MNNNNNNNKNWNGNRSYWDAAYNDSSVRFLQWNV